MRVYLDTSVAGVSLLHDPGIGKIRHWWRTLRPSLYWSDLTRGELVSAISLRVSRSVFTAEEGRRIVGSIDAFAADWAFALLQPEDVAAATELVARFDLHLKLPDAIHISVAQRLDCTLASADRQQLVAARAIGVTIIDPLGILWSTP